MIINKEKIKKLKMLVYGDFMIDQYIFGDVDRISPEAPVPILNVKKKEIRLGGAGNLINNLNSLGVKTKTLGFIGNDDYGKILIEKLKNINTDTKYLFQNKENKTIVKSRVGTDKQYFIRIDEENKIQIKKETENVIRKSLKDLFSDVSIFIVSDYGKGTVSFGILSVLLDYCKKNNIISIVDPKGKDYEKYRGCTFCTPNVSELEVVINSKICTENDILHQSLEICKKYDIKNIILTRSEKGISWINKSGHKEDFSVRKIEVADVCGAGDTVVAMFGVMQALNASISESCIYANSAASIVCSKKGTSVCYFEEVFENREESKIVSSEELKKILIRLKKEDKKIVFTNGCFDLLHIGHIDSFKKAKEFGDILIVAVNSDNSIKKIKGENRPIINEIARAKMISSLEIVDFVIIMDELTPIKLIEELKPDISIKGEDWKDKFIPEKEIIEKYGGRMEFIKFENDISTTKIIEKVGKRSE